MLRNSCDSSVLKIRLKFTDVLSRFGIQATFDPSTAALTLKLRDKVGKDPSPSELLYSLDFNASSDFFSASEDVVNMVEREYASLFQAALFSLQNNSASSDIFSFGLFIEVNVLTASLSALVRTIIHSLSLEVEKLSSQESFNFRRFMKTFNGLLVVSRSAWLMQCRISILRKLFARIDFDRIDKKSILSSFSQKFSFSSYQIKSAFDIADTDGDGLLNHKEYLEAIQALGIAEVNRSISSFFHTVTFLEFSMLCAHFASTSHIDPISQLSVCLSVLVAHSHSVWAKFLSKSAYRSIALSTVQGYRTLLESSNVNRTPVKASELLYPSDVSSALLKYLFKVSHHFYSALISVDTVQTRGLKKAGAESSSPEDKRDVYLENMLVATKESGTTTFPDYLDGLPGFVAARIVGEALRVIDETVETAVKTLFDEPNFEDSTDQVCLQIIYDLKLCDHMIKKLSDVKSKHFDHTNILVSVRAKISRVKGQMSSKFDFSESILEANFSSFLAKNSYLLILFVSDMVNSGERAKSKSNSSVFANSSTNRLQLLPLPLKSVRSNFPR